jgi:thiamine biosynthesis lipoprotein
MKNISKSFCIFVIAMTVSAVSISSCKRANYLTTDGFTQGTTYHVVYSDDAGYPLDSLVALILNRVDSSLSVYNPKSIISAVNRGEDIEADSLLINVFKRSREVYEMSKGAFDVSASPLFNIWGFGFGKKETVTSGKIDSALALTGMDKIKLEGNRFVFEVPGMSMNFNAIAQGYTSDVIAQEFDRLGIANYLIEVGGEITCKGQNREGKEWSVGIDKPVEGNVIQGADIQDVILLTGGGLATSGNYRKFYEEDGQVFSHTIDPLTGYPVRHNLLSATIIAPDAMTADAYATWFMVVGLEKAIEVIESDVTIEGYLVYALDGEYKVYRSKGIKTRD